MQLLEEVRQEGFRIWRQVIPCTDCEQCILDIFRDIVHWIKIKCIEMVFLGHCLGHRWEKLSPCNIDGSSNTKKYLAEHIENLS